MKYLILGGNGFIGSHLVKSLHDNGDYVRVYDKSINASIVNIAGVDYITGDFTDTFSLAEALTGIDVVYHLISTTLPSTSNLDMVNDVQTNLISTLRLLQMMVDMNVKNLVFLSSGGTVYGNPSTNPIPESHSLNPICSYGVVKASIEKYIFLFNQLHSLNYNILRVSNPYGANQQHFGIQGVIPTFLSKAFSGQPITIWGDGTIERDYIYINDLINVTVQAGKKMYNDVYNIGSGELTSINEIITTIQNVTNMKLTIDKQQGRSFDVQSISLDCTNAIKQFKWTPKYSLTHGITESWKHLNDA